MESNYNSFNIKEIRNVSSNIDPIFIQRWSPRAFSGDPIDEKVVAQVLEAGRLAPSSGNTQPWVVVYAHRETPDWDTLFSLLVEANQAWVKNGAVLFLFLSRTVSKKGHSLVTHSFDTGSFWMSMALEAFRIGFPLHGMAGFDYERARSALHIPDIYHVDAMACMGVPGPLETLSEQNREREAPSFRKSLEEIAVKANRATNGLPDFKLKAS